MRLTAVLVGIFAMAPAAWSQGAGPPPDSTVHTIIAEAERLDGLSKLQFTPEQLRQLIAIAKTVDEKRAAIGDHVRNPEALQTAWAIRTAMLKGEDPGDLWQQLEAFWQQGEQLEQELQAARREAGARAFNVLTAEQIAILGERNIEAEAGEMFEQARHTRALPTNAWVEWATQAVGRIARIAWADDPDAADKVRTDLAAFLGRLRKLTDEELAKEEEELRGELQTLLEDAQPQAADKVTQALARDRLAGLVVHEDALETLRAKLNAPATQ